MQLNQIIGHFVQSSVNKIADRVNDLFNKNGNKDHISHVASIPGSIIGHTTLTDSAMLSDDTPIAAPVNQDLNHTPTTSEFLNASNAADTLGGTPEGLEPFTVNGRQLAIADAASGMEAKVWVTNQNQVIVSFAGTGGGDNIVTNPVAGLTSFVSGLQTDAQTVSQSEKDALSFTHYVVDEAQKRGIDTNNIFVTGHGLGGTEASYVAQQTGLAGVSFGATGIPGDATSVGNGSNFVNVVTHGDPIGNFANDTNPNNTIVTSMSPGQDGNFNHYGQVMIIGDSADTANLQAAESQLGSGIIKDVSTIVKVMENYIGFNSTATMTADMGITLSNHSFTVDQNAIQHGTVMPVGNDHIGQILAPVTSHDANILLAS